MSHIPPATGIRYLKIVAIARIFLDNIIHIQAGWLTEGLKPAQIALTMGATDMGGVLTEELVVKATGIETRTTKNELIDIIKNAGKIPVQRDSEYRVIRVFSEIFKINANHPPYQKKLSMKMITLDIAFSPCPNDTFIFHAMVSGSMDNGRFRFIPHLDDVEALNSKAFNKTFPVSKLSFYAYLMLKNHYEILDSGGALGYGCGPLLVGKSAAVPGPEAKIAIPGKFTTAHLLLKLWHPEFTNVEITRFDNILEGVLSGRYDAGLIIHEGRFVYPQYGLKKIVDLGEWWEEETGLPIPLGCIAIRKDHPFIFISRKLESILKRSVTHAFDNRIASRAFIKTMLRNSKIM
jgi:1,4-dihydroxy-6-naphthoate synthase